MRKLLRQPGLRRTRDKLLFALAYGAIAAAVLFGNPLPGLLAGTPPMAALENPAP
ncbi:hypothetical protein MKI84_15145 [Ancylobacter sp. A5.8]|uniref:hypothetical protein n=1 Tax=Ancylobacter gelatini TaxID=2919920 RepID=UPI001F4EA9B1|nr:hypothetical protein [Ancylobacter gelatini]MCJ8144257.1 hypothetical protein [Ancylobacter gelatini]